MERLKIKEKVFKLLCLLPIVLFFSCASSNVRYPNNAQDPNAIISSPSQEGTIISALPDEQMLKSKLDSEAAFFLELGSPEGIRKAVEKIRVDPSGMSELNRSALALASELMKALYPLEKITWNVPSVQDQNIYARIIRAAKSGIADYSGGNDFFALTLPALSLFYTHSDSLPLKEMDLALERAFAINPKSVLPLWFRAKIAARQNRSGDAYELYRKAWELDKSCYPAGVGLAEALIRMGNNSLALNTALAILERYPSYVEAMRVCAQAYAATGNWQAAEAYVSQALKIEPNRSDILLLRAQILVEKKSYMEANAILDTSTYVNSTDRDYLLLKARIALEWSKNTAQAASFLESALNLYPRDEAILLIAAKTCYEKEITLNGMDGRALAMQIIRQNPNNSEVLTLLANDYIDSLEWQNALSTAERLYSVSQNETSSLILARAYAYSGQSSRAMSIMRPLYVSNPNNEEIADLYIKTLIDTGDSSGARRIIDSLMEGASPSLKSKLYYHLSRLQSDPEQELSFLRSSLLSDPRNGDALFAMFSWYFREGEYHRAHYYLKQAVSVNSHNREYARRLSELDAMLGS